jgi:hypothetical protein
VTNTSAGFLAAQDGPWTQTRTGVVVEATGSTAIILVGATTFSASITVPFGVTDTSAAVPAPGTLVTVLRQDSSWTIIGQVFGVSNNLILNGSFEDSPPGSFPVNWNFYNISGSSDVSVVDNDSAVNGDQVLKVSTTDALAAASYTYSSPVNVDIGDVIQLSVFVGAAYEEGTAETADAALYALWFANDTNLYPTTSSADTLIASANDVIPSPPWTPLSGQIAAPVTGVVRLALRSSIIGGQNLLFDFAFVRKIS